MVLMAGFELPVRAIRQQISAALDLIVQQARMKDGSRKVTRITEVIGLEGDTIVLQDIFVYNERKNPSTGRREYQFTTSRIRPNCIEKFSSGYNINAMFKDEWA